jgi:hypothetical protein
MFDFGISKLIGTLDKNAKRRAARADKLFSDLRVDLASIQNFVVDLDKISSKLLSGYADRKLVADSKKLNSLVEATRAYLHGRELVPRLVTLQDDTKSRSTDQRLARKDPKIPQQLNLLAQDIQDYLVLINFQGPSGVQHKELNELCYLAEREIKAKKISPDDIVAKANDALRGQQHDRSLAIVGRVGAIQGLLK